MICSGAAKASIIDGLPVVVDVTLSSGQSILSHHYLSLPARWKTLGGSYPRLRAPFHRLGLWRTERRPLRWGRLGLGRHHDEATLGTKVCVLGGLDGCSASG